MPPNAGWNSMGHPASSRKSPGRRCNALTGCCLFVLTMSALGIGFHIARSSLGDEHMPSLSRAASVRAMVRLRPSDKSGAAADDAPQAPQKQQQQEEEERPAASPVSGPAAPEGHGFSPDSGALQPAPSTNRIPASNGPRSTRPRRPFTSFMGQNCTCVDSTEVDCSGEKVHLIEEAVRAACPIREAIRAARLEARCRMSALEGAKGMQPWPGVPRSIDEIAAEECPAEFLDIKAIIERDELSAEYLQQRRRGKAALLISAVVATSAALPLWWETRKGPVFYDHDNMWWLRGWEKGRRHSDPFTEATKKFLPAAAPEAGRKSWGSCAVVGNSGVLLQQGLGGNISAHDTIIRINQASFQPQFHPFIGNRTDVRLLNKMMTSLYATKWAPILSDDRNTAVVVTRAETKMFERLGALLRRRHPDKTLLFSTDVGVGNGVALLASMRAGLEEATGLTYKGGNSPSSGLLAAILASQMCSSVVVYGFSLGNCLGSCPPYHYWSRKNGKERNTGTSYKGHQYDVEGWLLKALHVMGLVCISPQPPKLPPCGSRLGGILDKHGSIAGLGQDLVDLQRFELLLLSNRSVQNIVLGKPLSRLSRPIRRQTRATPEPRGAASGFPLAIGGGRI